MKRLVVNADDFGLTAGVNRAIIELHRHGTLTSATLMANADATDAAIAFGKSAPTLGVGCHVVLVDGSPLHATAGEVAGLLTPGGNRFPRTLGQFLRHHFLGGPSHANAIQNQIEIEVGAQIASLQGQGIHPTHIDTHKHTHMFPRVLRPVLRAARRAGIRCVRNPFEPAWSVNATPNAPLLRRMQVKLLRTLEPAFRRIVAEEGFTTTDGAVGVLATGTLDAATLTSLLRAMPAGTWELVTHPGYNDRDLASAGTRLLGSREIEFKALRDLALAHDIELIHFGQLNSNR